ncbi:hypothetical protein BEE12_22840 (plasmid) [Pantoea agglomerans]|uniref:hypothetical protein n=1 Tax=Enterobacter agglomerans TaxID=549 RepID=UPI00083DA798|nr:hypothetical protein [Pantoea agglomerans]AOE42628.1 hypothetical protein BEE12_22840 [Pantoea agglomerans]
MNDSFGVDPSLLPDHMCHSVMPWLPLVLATGLVCGFLIGRVSRAKEKASETTVDSSAAASGRAIPASVPFGSREMAAVAAAEVNSHYWQHMLAVFETTLEEEGFALCTEPQEKVPLPYPVRARVGTAIVKARYRYLAPLQSERSAEAMLRDAEKDDYTGSWTDWCQRGAEAAGWYVVRRDGKAMAGNSNEMRDTV